MRKLLIVLLMLILASTFVNAADIKTYHSSFTIIDNKVIVGTDVLFNEKTTDSYEFQLPEDFRGLDVYVDEQSVSPNVTNNLLKLDLKQNSKVTFDYVTNDFIDKTNFLMNFRFNFDADNLIIKLVLPEGASLKKPLKEEDLSSGSIYPKPTKATTNGKNLIFYWLKDDVKQREEISIFAQIEPKNNYLGLVFLLIALILITFGTFLVLYKKKPKILVKHEDMVEKHLKQEEEQIVNILKDREGSCEQGTLRIVTGFSKATLSRLLSELEARNVVKKEKRGKKNIVFLRK